MNDNITEINKDTFWELIQSAKETCGQDMDAMMDFLKDRLVSMGPEQAQNFHDILHAYEDLADKFGLWDAAGVMKEYGCSDDGFIDFRAWLIAQGWDTYLSALADPDSLAEVIPYHVEWTVLNSKCFGVPQSRRRLFLIGYLDPRCAGKILPVFGTGGKALVQVLGGPQGSRIYDADGVACTQTAGAGGMGGKTGLYLVGFNRKDGIVGKRDTAIPLNASDFRGINRNQTQNAVLVDLCSGHPKQTDAARCLTARYGQTTLSNRKGERSGVLLIKEATKKGYKEAQPGDTVDLGYAGSNTRRGRVGCDIAHTLETSCIQGIVENGGRIRRLMPRECLRLQGFEEWQIDRILAIQSDAQAYKQAGNSVTVNVIEAIAKRIQVVDEELKTGAAA